MRRSLTDKCVSVCEGETKSLKNIRLLMTDEFRHQREVEIRLQIMRVKLLLLLHLLVAALSSAALLEDNTGQRFILVYPESIAYYHPIAPKLLVYITALYNGTTITFIQYNYATTSKDMTVGECQRFAFDARMELGKTEISEKTLEIKSNKNITVQAISVKENSIQSAAVIPADKLGTKYFIPPVPQIEGTTQPADLVTSNVTERSPFRLIIVNGDQANTVTLEGETEKTFPLQPKQVRQVWLEGPKAWKTVTADNPVAVIFGHPCAARENCTCGALYTILPPAEQNQQEKNLKFFIPPSVAEEGKAFVLISEKNSTKIEAFRLDSPVVTASGTAILYSPGLLLALIPESDFAACYAITSKKEDQDYSDAFALIVVHKDFTDGVHLGKDALAGADWKELKDTNYVSAQVDLQPGKNIIWHPSTKMAVYFAGKKEDVVFGNPAPVISKSPDFRGCAVVPEVLEIGDVADGWQESLKYCKDKNLTMVTLSNRTHQAQIYQKIRQDSSVKEVWIGMRRSSFSGDWYWFSGQDVSHSDWGEGEPGKAGEGQCAIMRKKNTDFDWEDEVCCKAVRPVCYKDPYLFLSP